MTLRTYGQIVGNTCVSTITFDPVIIPVAEMAGTLGTTLLPVQDYLGGQWGVGATYDGLDVRQDVPLLPDAGTLVEQVSVLQGQVDDLTSMVLEDSSTSITQSAQITTGSTGQASFTWPVPFTSLPRVVATTRIASTASYATMTEVLAISLTAVTIRAWQLRSVVVGANPAVVLTSIPVQVIAYGPA